MNTMKLTLLFLIISTTACVATPPGTYQRDGDGNINASGQAAVEAARSTRTYRTECDGCTVTNDYRGTQSYNSNSTLSHFDAIPHRHRPDGSCIYPSSWRSDADIYRWWNERENDLAERSARARYNKSQELLDRTVDNFHNTLMREINGKVSEIFR